MVVGKIPLSLGCGKSPVYQIGMTPAILFEQNESKLK